jgi:hypothetical protein
MSNFPIARGWMLTLYRNGAALETVKHGADRAEKVGISSAGERVGPHEAVQAYQQLLGAAWELEGLIGSLDAGEHGTIHAGRVPPDHREREVGAVADAQ